MLKILIPVAFLTLSISVFANGVIKDNFCVPRIDSKRYLTSDFSTKYPRTVRFECTYECQADGRIDLVTGPLSVQINNIEDDAKMVVCQGVKVKKVPWGYDFDGVEAFYAYDTGVKAIKAYAFTNVNRNNRTETEYLRRLKSTLTTVAATYKSTGVSYFIEAADIMFQISSELPASTKTLDRYVDILVKKNGISPLEGTAQSLVLANITGSAAWRIPTHLYK